MLAAHRAGIRRIVLPSRNEADIEEIPEDVRRELEIILVSRIGEVIDATLEKMVANPPPSPPPSQADTARDARSREHEAEPLHVQKQG